MSSKEFQTLIDILQTPASKKRKTTTGRSQAPGVKSLNEQKRRVTDQKLTREDGMSILRMPNDHVNFQAVHENNGMLKALISHQSEEHAPEDVNRNVDINSASIEALTEKFNIEWKDTSIFEGQITLQSMVDDSLRVEHDLTKISSQVAFLFDTVIDFGVNQTNRDRPGVVPFVHIIGKDTTILESGKIEFIPNSEDFGILCELPKLLPVQTDSKGKSMDVISKSILPPMTWTDEISFHVGRTWNQWTSSLPMDFNTYETYLVEGDENHMGRIDLKNASRPKKEYENMNSCSEYSRRCYIPYDNFVPDNAYNMGNIKVSDDLPVQMSHVIVIDRNSVKSVEIKAVSGNKLDEVTPTVRVQDSLKHAVPGEDYCKVQECNCDMEDEITTYYNENNSNKFSHEYMKEEQQLGVLCPESQFHVADKIDVTSTLKDSAIPSETIPYSKAKTRIGYVRYVKPPSYQIKVIYRLGWLPSSNYEVLFGYPYRQDGITMKMTNTFELTYDKYGRSHRYNWKGTSRKGKTYLKDKILLDTKHLRHSSCARISAGIHIVDVDESDITEYVTKPVKSFRNPMYRLCCPHV